MENYYARKERINEMMQPRKDLVLHIFIQFVWIQYSRNGHVVGSLFLLRFFQCLFSLLKEQISVILTSKFLA